MKLRTAFIPLAALLLASCSGLSKAEQQAAKAHAENLCLLAHFHNRLAEVSQDSPFGGELAQVLANGGDVHAWANPNGDGKVLAEANRIAREQGCVK